MGNTVAKSHSILIAFANHQNIVSVANMDANFQTCALQIAPPVIVVKFPHCFVMPAVPLFPQPNIKPMQINIADERPQYRTLWRTFRVFYFTGILIVAFLNESVDIVENHLVTNANVP